MNAGVPAAALRLRDVSVALGGRTALSHVDLSVPPGEFLALAGPNGSGKTTLLRSLLGLVAATTGSIELWGEPLGRLSVRARALRQAWVPQQEPLQEDVPLERYLLYGRYAINGPLGTEGGTDAEKVTTLLAQIGLADRRHDSVLALSGGERQRAALGRALAQETPVLLLDEPTSHLDIGHQLDLLERVRALARERRVTVVAALHDLNLAARYADRIVVLAHGRKVADGTPPEVLSPELLARVWGIEADLRNDPASGRPYLFPRRLLRKASERGSRAGTVHVVGGGGSASPILHDLVDAGFDLSAGALHLLDTDAETAEALAIPAAVEAPFAPLGPAVRERHRELLARARAVVVAPFAVGPSNLANLEDLRPFAGRLPLLLVRAPPIERRDFCGGRATALYRELREAGATEVDDVRSVRDVLARLFEAERAPGGPGDARASPAAP